MWAIQTWQFNHLLPYENGITEDIYHNLFVSVGLDEGLRQKFFQKQDIISRFYMDVDEA